MKIVVIGTGYVGLVTGTCFAEVGHHVVCVDIDREKIEKLQQGIIPIFEPGLQEKVKRNIREKRLHFTTSYAEAVPGANAIFLALPTPATDDGSANLTYLENAAREVANHLTGYTVIVSKSTAPLGTTQKIKEWIDTPHPIDIVSNPEFLKQGNAVNDFMKPDRVVIGVETEEAASLMRRIYAPFSLNHDRLLVMDLASAEMTKYTANFMLASRISLMNELAGLCEKTGADINKVRLGVGSDSRIGYHFLYAGLGYGGSCFPKDLIALETMGHAYQCDMPILTAVQHVNERQRFHFCDKILSHFNGDLTGKTLGILGLAFKPETDDIRNAPSIFVIDQLLSAGAKLHLYDPVAMPKAKQLLEHEENIAWASDEEACATDADALVLVTEWKQFRLLDFETLGERMKSRVLFDGRNQYKPEEMTQVGFEYISVGRPSPMPCLV